MSEALSKETNKKQADLPPEGGTQAWLCVIGAFLTIFCTFGFLNAYLIS
jgi:hypothetical protein